MDSQAIRKLMNETDIARFWSKVKKKNGCWEWLGGFYPSGRPAFWLVGANNVLAYRISYILCVGDIPPGKQLDHIKCDNKSCVNPWHVEPKTARQNVLRSNAATAINARKKTCKRGHPLVRFNKGWKGHKEGWRYCPKCDRDRQRLKRATLRLFAWYGKLRYAQDRPHNDA